ncbi:MAG TPA: hypothetical protein VGO62_01460, partial [Myxococcota bacterium]
MKARVLVVTGLLSAVVGCTSVDSADIKTHGIQPGMTVTSSAGATTSHVSVAFHVGDSIDTFVTLQDDESVTASVGTTPVKLAHSEILGFTSYDGDLPTNAAGTTVTIALSRPTDTSAPSSSVTMTDQLTLTSPTGGAGANVSRANDDVTVAWTSDTSADGVTVLAQGDCIDTFSTSVAPPNTSAIISKGTLKKKTGDNIADTCAVTFAAERSRSGTVDAAYGGGSISDTFSSSATLQS